MGEKVSDDARIKIGFARHPKTQKLIKRLGHQGGWSLLCMLLHCAEERWTGSLAGMDNDDIAIASCWAGDSNEFVRALVELRLLDGSPGNYSIHDWAEHNPFAATTGQRIESARAAAAARWGNRPGAHGMPPAPPIPAPSMQPACDPHATRMQDASDAQCEIMPGAMPTPPHPTTPPPSPPKTKSSAIALPDWLPIEAWAGFVEMRKRTKAVLTDKAITLAIGELEKLRAQGCDPAEVLNQSTMNAWKGLFPIKQANGTRGRPASVLHGPFHGGDYRGNLGGNPDGTVNF